MIIYEVTAWNLMDWATESLGYFSTREKAEKFLYDIEHREIEVDEWDEYEYNEDFEIHKISVK